MNYYEELGLTESSSTEEIRQAYRSLARLLHPDRQRDEQLRRYAELQMRRLNHVLAVLIDPPRRAAYDESIRPAPDTPFKALEQRTRGRKRIHIAHFHIGRFRIDAGTIAWSASLVLAAVGLSFALLYFEPGAVVSMYGGNAVRQASPQAVPAAIQSPVKGHATHQPTVRRTQPQVNSYEAPPAQSPSPIAAIPPDILVPNPVGPDPDSPEPSALPSNPAPLSAVETQLTLVGKWLYAKSSSEETTSAGTSSYPPVYIELVVKRIAGPQISGKYLGRFQVPDQALSSEITFTFEGPATEGTTVLPWHSSDGAEGQVRVKLVSDGLVEVTWFTTHFGAGRNLASGTALLRRD